MNDDTRADQPAISCRGVWQVFGPNAKSKLKEALNASGGDAQTAADRLRQDGLIPAVQDASFDVNRGELFVIMGLSGSGKSTIVRCISRLVEATGGQIDIDGQSILEASKAQMIELRRRKLGMVFQHFGLFPHMTVAENVAFPLKMQGQGKRDRLARAHEVINLVGLDGREASYPRQLSGGQRQRVGIARSLAVNPDIWFLDEPFSALDPLIRRQLQDEFINIQATLKKSIVFITHDIAEALKIADRIAIMRDGRIVQIGTPTEIVLKPVDDYVREFSKDVVKGRHARISSVLRPLSEAPDNMPDDPGIRQDMTLEEALGACISLYEPVPVHDAQGRVIGVVHPSDLAAALQVEET
ncbi:betaine/proline/choline family ABC transporter ATP-binding protein [Pseudohalocynthiibacter aestuariivivens]|uniref:Quaternary amine transport ATP-binding protein n=1 Tax=Roseovarius pelagicus TaxID=2980108 RepID=A0ABY6DD32_9RHOB|nr:MULTISPECIES: betaine/proline/choline family ABC transporter ATP-binding protein [Rhodobacterales]QIE44314.1 betaine/proline/choline family ABC transporter ATP-binding protein [Pseudohalocynthiibacter aestuariivivens]UXX83769.1 betaine/proline/choline family ABC transporter ATP-binding protein [Roseovarius pelagicus]